MFFIIFNEILLFFMIFCNISLFFDILLFFITFSNIYCNYSWITGMLVTTFLCFKIDMGLGIVVGVLITKAIAIAKSLRKNIQIVQLKVSGNSKLIGQNI